MLRKVTTKICKICGGPIRYDRYSEYCSKKCQAVKEGYSDSHKAKLKLELLKAGVDATTAWKPLPLDPVQHVISGYPIPVFSDMHFPYQSSAWILQGLACASIWQSEYLILNGDVMDMNELSRHHGHYYRRRKELGDDLESFESFLKLVCPLFKRVYWISGNHCLERLIKCFKGELNAQRVGRLVGSFDNLVVSSRSFLDVNDNVRLCHPRQYSPVRGSLAQKLSQRWQKHIGTGHQHHACMTFSPDGKWQAADIPAMVDSDNQDYVRNELNTFAEPICGFGAVFNNYIQVFTNQTPFEMFGLPRVNGI